MRTTYKKSEIYNFRYEDIACVGYVLGYQERARLSLSDHRQIYKSRFMQNFSLWLSKMTLLKKGFLVPCLETGELMLAPFCRQVFESIYTSQWKIEFTLHSPALPEKTMFLYLSEDGKCATMLTNDKTGEWYSVIAIPRKNIPEFVVNTSGVPPAVTFTGNLNLDIRSDDPVTYSQYLNMVSAPRDEYYGNRNYKKDPLNKSVFKLLTLSSLHGSFILRSVNGNSNGTHEGVVFFFTIMGGHGFVFPNPIATSEGRHFICSAETVAEEIKSLLDHVWINRTP